MRITYTKHAEHQLKERNLEKTWVEETVKNPDETKRKKHKYNAIKKLNGIKLKVIYVKENYIKIITVFQIR